MSARAMPMIVCVTRCQSILDDIWFHKPYDWEWNTIQFRNIDTYSTQTFGTSSNYQHLKTSKCCNIYIMKIIYIESWICVSIIHCLSPFTAAAGRRVKSRTHSRNNCGKKQANTHKRWHQPLKTPLSITVQSPQQCHWLWARENERNCR